MGTSRLKLLFVFLSLILPACGVISGRSTLNRAPGEQRGRRLRRGINLSLWFTPGPKATEHYRSFIASRDIALIKRLNFTHVRLPFDPQLLFNEKNPTNLDAGMLQLLDESLTRLLDSGLAVIIDPHPSRAFKERLAKDPSLLRAFNVFWKYLARHLRKRDPEAVFLEVLNEPRFDSSGRWQEIQKKIIRTIREEAPEHTLIVSGNGGESIDELLRLSPLSDPNVIYNFHFYEPAVFTHQGADWGPKYWKVLKNIPYPPSRRKITPVLTETTPWFARQRVKQYLGRHWDRHRIKERIRKAAAWAKNNNLSLICDEFGVYRPFAPVPDRNRWIKDVRTALEEYGIGWTFWDYCSGFGLVTGTRGRRKVDAGIGQSLGLPPVPALNEKLRL